MPTLCSMCGGTYGRCESCKKADAMIQHHENPAAKAALSATLASFEVKLASTDAQQQADDQSGDPSA